MKRRSQERDEKKGVAELERREWGRGLGGLFSISSCPDEYYTTEHRHYDLAWLRE